MSEQRWRCRAGVSDRFVGRSRPARSCKTVVMFSAVVSVLILSSTTVHGVDASTTVDTYSIAGGVTAGINLGETSMLLTTADAPPSKRNAICCVPRRKSALAKHLPGYTVLLLFAVVLIAVTVACTNAKTFPLQGEVLAKNASTDELTIKHGDIPGFMPAMTMPYKIKDATLMADVEVGDKIAAQASVDKKTGEYWLENIQVTNRSGRGQVKLEAPHMLSPGEKVPDIPLVNQDGHTIRFADFKGKAVLLTFIYTRCPMPTFCPRLSSQFAKIHNELKKMGGDYDRTHLLTVSFDPKYDTAPVLRKYGLAYLDGDETGFSHWDFASTDATDLRSLAEAFGLQYEEQDNQIAHTMSIVLIGPDERVVKSWSVEWTSEELLGALRSAAAGKDQTAQR